MGDTELLLIIIFAFLLFGPDKLPSMGRTIGRGIKQFRQASDSVTKVVKSEVLNPLSEAAQTEAGLPKPAGEAAAAEPVPQRERPTETFAERRARLAREREEQAAAAAAAAEVVPETGDAAVLEQDAERAPMTNVAPLTATAEETASSPAGDHNQGVAEVVEMPQPVTSVASMWGLDESPVESGEEDATLKTA